MKCTPRRLFTEEFKKEAIKLVTEKQLNIIDSKPEATLGESSLSTLKCSTTVSGDMQKLTIKVQLISQVSITLITQLQHNHYDLPFY